MADKTSNFLKADVREFTTRTGKIGYNIDVNVKDLERFPLNQYWQARLTMRPRNEKWKYGETHFIVENDFKSDWQSEKKAHSENLDAIPDNWSRNDDLPF